MKEQSQKLKVLLPCPFCGNADIEINRHINSVDGIQVWSCACPICHASTGLYTKSQAISSWNARAV